MSHLGHLGGEPGSHPPRSAVPSAAWRSRSRS